MSKYRGIFIILSALLWGLALWGISKIKPTMLVELFEDVNAIETEVEKPPPPPPPPPPPETKLPPPPIVERKPDLKINVSIPDPIKRVTEEEVRPPPAPVKDLPPAPPPPPLPPVLLPPPPPPPPIPSCTEKDTEPKRITQFNNEDAYPAAAADEGIEGTATISAQIDANGRVTSASVVGASNSAFKAKSVTDEAKRQKYKPARRDCKDVATSYTYTIKFQL